MIAKLTNGALHGLTKIFLSSALTQVMKHTFPERQCSECIISQQMGALHGLSYILIFSAPLYNQPVGPYTGWERAGGMTTPPVRDAAWYDNNT
jgi:hypothetical protein